MRYVERTMQLECLYKMFDTKSEKQQAFSGPTAWYFHMQPQIAIFLPWPWCSVLCHMLIIISVWQKTLPWFLA